MTKELTPTSRSVSRLEGKLDGIISLLSETQRNANHQVAPSNGRETSTGSPAAGELYWQPKIVPNQGTHGRPEAGTASPVYHPSVSSHNTPDLLTPHRTGESSDHIQIVSGFEVTFEEADASLALYRSTFTPYFPFVPIPVTITANELYHTAPLLLRTILQVVVPHDLQAQRRVDRWFHEYIAQQIVVEKKRRLELLQSILVFLAW